MSPHYFLPLVTLRSSDTVPLAGGPAQFSRLLRIGRDTETTEVHWRDVPHDQLEALCAARSPVAGLTLDRTRVMGILNVTPDSFSDGGAFLAPSNAIAQARAMLADRADLIDIGGESTRPGADLVPVADELSRTIPVISALAGLGVPLSIDTRKAKVAEAALAAGAAMLNDVSALGFDPGMAQVAATSGAPICLMHAQGDPKTMQTAPTYDHVVLDVYDWLAARAALAIKLGITPAQIVLDPGIGFGKTIAHNLDLLRHLALFHGLGYPLLVGASRKRFIGVIGDAPEAADRLPGSLAVAVHAASQGVQILRVHDTKATRQALALQEAIQSGEGKT